MTRRDGWTWEFQLLAVRAFEGLNRMVKQRLVSKLDEIVTDEQRDPPEYIKPLSGVPHGKIRIGDYRLGAAADRNRGVMVIYDIEHRSGAYHPGDD